MNLIYNGTDLATLGVFRILGQTTVREPAEAPQRERVSYRVRLDFFEQNFSGNQNLVQQLRSALTTQNAQMVWQDGSNVFVNRTVTAAADEEDTAALDQGGTYHQAITFSFWYYNHDIVTNCLDASWTRGTGSNPPTLDLGAVEKWEERRVPSRVYEFSAVRKKVEGTVTASGRLQGDTTTPLAARQAALLALKDQLM